MTTVEYAQHRVGSLTLDVREHECDLMVVDRQVVAEDVVVLTLGDQYERRLPEWEPGAHIDLVLDDGLVRQYSLCGDPADRDVWRVGVLRAPDSRGGSILVHDRLAAGAQVTSRGPRNHFALSPSRKYLFIAGGIGITPILTMIGAAEAAGAEWQLVYGGRHRASMAFVDELSRYGGDRVTVWPQDEQGLIDLDALLGEAREHTLVYCCGPEPLLAAVEERCAGWPKGSLRVERFSAKPMNEPVLADAFEIELQQSGLTLTVPPDRSIIEVAQEAGVNVLARQVSRERAVHQNRTA